MNKGHRIKEVKENSIAWEMEIEPGDLVLSVNDKKIEDVFDYHYLISDWKILLFIEKSNGEEWELEIEKDCDEDLGIIFEQGLMDEYRSCKNQCVFCFIDQMPPGMRETLYFKDDDARLSFLQGNYITLTNMNKEDLERIIKYKLSPVNISVHTTNPKLRNKMLHNRFAGDALEKIKILYENGIDMNSQIVLCKGLNDGAELEKTIEDLSRMLPHMKSLSVVPVGLTKYREGLAPLEKFTSREAVEVLAVIGAWQERLLKQYGTRFVYASDEWFFTAGIPIPGAEYYEGFGQIENGVGMVRSLTDEFNGYLDQLAGDSKRRQVALVTGKLFEPVLRELTVRLYSKYPGLSCNLYGIENEFFGSDITVAGLVCGQDIINQLQGRELGDCLLLPDVMLRSGEEVLLDDITVSDLKKALQTDVRIVQSDGISLINQILKTDDEEEKKRGYL